MKQYYCTIDNGVVQYWYGDSAKASLLLKFNRLILPLGTRKPRNVSRETLKQF